MLCRLVGKTSDFEFVNLGSSPSKAKLTVVWSSGKILDCDSEDASSILATTIILGR